MKASRLPSKSFFPGYPDTAAVCWLLAVTVALYARALSVGFTGDDFTLFRALSQPDFSLADRFPAGRGTYFRPLLLLMLLVEQRLGGPWLHHFVNIAVHAANVILLYSIGRVLGVGPGTAIAPALFFGTHPANVTNVFWISGRGDVLSGFGLLLSLGGTAVMLRGHRALGLGIAAIGTLIALLAKENGVVAPFQIIVVILMWYAIQGRPPRRREFLAATTVVLLASALTAAYLYYISTRFYLATGRLPAPLGGTAVRVFLHSLILMFSPTEPPGLRFLYFKTPQIALLFGTTLLVTVAVITAWMGRRCQLRVAQLGIAALMPLGPIIPLMVGGTSHPRHVYVPLAMLGIAALYLFALGGAGKRGQTRLQPAATVILCATIAFSCWTYRSATYWVANWQHSRNLGMQFSTLLRDAPEDRLMVVANWPFEANGFPVFSNDLNEALYYYHTGRFGIFPRFHPLAGLNTSQPTSSHTLETSVHACSIRVHAVAGEGGSFVFPRMRRALESPRVWLRILGGDLEIVSETTTGDAYEFEMTLDKACGAMLFYYTTREGFALDTATN